MPHLGPFHFAPHRIHHGKAHTLAAATKSYPVRNIDFSGNGLGGDMQIPYPKKADTEKQPLYFGEHNFLRLSIINQRLGAVAGLEIGDLPLLRAPLEVVEIERPVDGVQAENALVTFAAVENFNLKKLERN